MLVFTKKEGNVLHYEVSGLLSAGELSAYYAVVDTHYRRYGKLRLLVRVQRFRGYAGPRALLVFLQHEAGLLRKVRRYAAVTDQRWFRRFIGFADGIFPSIEFRAFGAGETEAAARWLVREAGKNKNSI